MLFSLVSPAVAAPIVTFDHDVRAASVDPFPNTTAARNSFLNQVTSLGGTPSHQNLSSGIPIGADPSFGFPGSGITASTTNLNFSGSPFFGVNDTNDGAAISVLIESEVATGVPTSAAHNSIDFSQPINAFGLYVSQVGDVLGHPITFRIENTLVPGSTRDIVINVGPNWQNYAIAYLGIIDSTSFNRFTMIEDTDVDNNSTSDDRQDGIMFDNLTIAAPVPEPGTLLLFAIGCAAPIGVQWRRQRSKGSAESGAAGARRDSRRFARRQASA